MHNLYSPIAKIILVLSILSLIACGGGSGGGDSSSSGDENNNPPVASANCTLGSSKIDSCKI